MNRFGTFPVCSVCKVAGKRIVKSARKFSVCADCPLPTNSQQEGHFYTHSKNTAPVWNRDFADISAGRADRRTVKTREEKI